jgi:hypothetical protein
MRSQLIALGMTYFRPLVLPIHFLDLILHLTAHRHEHVPNLRELALYLSDGTVYLFSNLMTELAVIV